MCSDGGFWAPFGTIWAPLGTIWDDLRPFGITPLPSLGQWPLVLLGGMLMLQVLEGTAMLHDAAGACNSLAKGSTVNFWTQPTQTRHRKGWCWP